MTLQEAIDRATPEDLYDFLSHNFDPNAVTIARAATCPIAQYLSARTGQHVSCSSVNALIMSGDYQTVIVLPAFFKLVIWAFDTGHNIGFNAGRTHQHEVG